VVVNKVLLLVFLTGLWACGMVPTPKASSPGGLATAADGLHPVGSDLQIGFGRAEEGVVAAVSRVLGADPAQRNTNTECGAGTVTTVSWAAGLDLMFQDGNFAGWTAAKPDFATVTGHAPGQTRDRLAGEGIEFQTTTLGTEFETDGVFGLIEGEAADSPVVLMWAGVTCFFR